MHYKRGALRTWENIRDHLVQKKIFYLKKYDVSEDAVHELMSARDLEDWNTLLIYLELVNQCIETNDLKKNRETFSSEKRHTRQRA